MEQSRPKHSFHPTQRTQRTQLTERTQPPLAVASAAFVAYFSCVQNPAIVYTTKRDAPLLRPALVCVSSGYRRRWYDDMIVAAAAAAGDLTSIAPLLKDGVGWPGHC